MAITATEDAEDADDVMLRAEKKLYRSMLDQGYSEQEVRRMRRHEKCRENAKMYAIQEKYNDDESEVGSIGIHLALAYQTMERDAQALETIRRTYTKVPDDIRVGMVLAKLLYRCGQMEESVEVCHSITQIGTRDDASGGNEQQQQDLGDAWYIMGWGELQKGDHSRAYEVWAKGSQVLPQDQRLARQCRKRLFWDEPYTAGQALEVQALVGAAPPLDASMETVAEAFAVHQDTPECALGLFDAASQRRRLVFRSRQPLLTLGECAAVVEHCEAAARARGGWGTVRHSTVKTTDVAVEDIPILRTWLRVFLATRLAPFLAKCYPKLADGTDMGPNGERVRIHDAFIVRYDAEQDMSLSLPAHSDISTLSFSVALNDPDPGGDGSHAGFEGGGTWFKSLGGRVVDASGGHAVSFAGPLRHAGHPVRKGTRIILVLFLYIEGFVYGELLKEAGGMVCSKKDAQEAEAEAEKLAHPDPGGYVVYNETYELVEALGSAQDGDEEDDEEEFFNSL